MDELFELIKALSPSEKRYFKRFAKQHSEDARPKYILLFDAYDSLDKFDQEALKSSVSDERILRYLNQEKKYLKDKLLDCLRVYRGGQTVNGKLFRLLEEREILNEMGLYRQGAKKLETAKKTALQYDKFSILIQVLSLERKAFLANSLNDSENARIEEWNRIDEELNSAVRSQENVARFQQTYLTILRIYRRRSYLKPGKSDVRSKLKRIRESEIFKDVSYANSFSAKHLYYLSLSMLDQLEGKIENASSIYEKLIDMWERRPDRISKEKRQFSLVLSNFLNIQHKLGIYDRFPEFLNRIRSFSVGNFDDQAENFQNLALLDLLFFMNRGIHLVVGNQNGSSFESIQSEIESGIEIYREKINPARLLIFYYNLMILNFLVGDITKANQWLIKIERSEFAKKFRREILDLCKVFQLIFLYELEEYSLIPSFYRNNKRFLERNDRLNDFYLISLNLVYKLSGVAGRGATMKILTEMHGLLQKSIEQSGEKNTAGQKEIFLWIRHKLEGKSLVALAGEGQSLE